ncbi:circularly permuted type 2 ATP-grasp protein [Rhodococcus sp. SORGH_AS_0301]|uniref:circularly permuted type 2 ATP-grasp protein n=1 Tax=Rhodococcus sp. SORGH_AS_0301 TaxID=3041780 RepID=UPI00278A9BAD|nr:circularly permuted type 2 ATP-grasp protein [Rhodococcus sp. SORGH_AS_0301]MDQ1180294.1 putative circularly permuted ATP-grasp superfamily protein/putative alpha-E superfamily protein [Rhodococcus sp. SORGH_AS_0301]
MQQGEATSPVLAAYLDEIRPDGHDDLVENAVDGGPRLRERWAALPGAEDVTPADLAAAQLRVGRLVDDSGITYNDTADASSESPSSTQSGARWELDVVPTVVSAPDWDRLEAGMLQRSRILDAVLTDLYGERTLIRRGLLPPEIVFRHRGYLRAAHGITIPGPHQLFFHAADIARCTDGEFRVLSDRTQAPSGAGYALADRSIVARAVPAVFGRVAPRPASTYVGAMRVALVEVAPAAAENPLVVVLSPGVWSETAFDQAHLASVLGFPLVESADLVVRDGALWMRSLGTLRRVDVVVRRVDDDYVDPLDLRPESRLGVVGLLEVARRGAVTVVNTIGSGALENAALFGRLPELGRALLGEEPLLDSVPAFWAGDPHGLSHIVSRIGSLVVYAIGSHESVVGPALSMRERDELVRRIGADPTGWAARAIPDLATSPVGPVGHRRHDAAVLPRPVGIRLFDVAGRRGYTPMTGGLAQVLVTDPPSEPMATTAAKDVWVLAQRRGRSDQPDVSSAVDAPRPMGGRRPRVIDSVSTPRVLDDLYWMGRYGERAEATARLLVAANQMVRDHRGETPFGEQARSDTDVALAVVLDAVTAVTATAPGFRAATTRSDLLAEFRSLTVRTRRTGSLAHAVAALQTCARAVRDQLGEDTWAVFNRLDTALAECAASPVSDEAGLWSTQSRVVGSMLAVAGLSAESMVHDPGWFLMDTGKRIERALQITALLAETVGTARPPAVEQAVLGAVLNAADSSVTYRRRYRGAPEVGAVAELVLFDGGNPRSVIHSVERAAVNLASLPGSTGTSRTDRALERIVATLRRVDPSDLEDVDATGTRSEFDDVVRSVHTDLLDLSESITAAHLTLPGGTQPLWGRGGGRVLS